MLEERASKPELFNCHALMSGALMDSRLPPGLDFALDYIFYNNLIEERHLLLRSRLVCRAFRTSKAFSGKITTVTLHTRADVQLAADLYPGLPHRRPPWRTVDESQAFPNLKTLKLSDPLVVQLYGNCCVKEFLGSVEKLDVDVSTYEWGPRVLNLAGIPTSLQLLAANHVRSVDSLFGRDAALYVFSRLTRLTICRLESSGFQSLHFLSQVSSLQHLQLSDLPIRSCSELGDCFCSCADLTQLTRLDLSGTTESISSDLHGDYEVMDAVMHTLAPPVLHDFRMRLCLEGLDEDENCCLDLSWSDGILRTVGCNCGIGIHSLQTAEARVSETLFKALCYNALSFHGSVDVDFKIRKNEFLIDVTNSTPIQGFSFELNVYDSMAQDDEAAAAADPSRSNGEAASALAAARSLTPVFMSYYGMQMAATQLKFGAFNRSEEDIGELNLTKLVQQLPLLFPCLQHLELHAYPGSFQPQDSIRQLTDLTHLSLYVHSTDNPHFSLSTPCLPASLRELSISSDNLKHMSLLSLEHLTKLMVWEHKSADKCSLEAVYRCQSPLKDLCLRGFDLQINLGSLAETFPRLETLDLQSTSFDLRALSNLHFLQKLMIRLPNSPTAVLTGVSTLTGMAVLVINNASEGHDGLCNLERIRRLRYFKYSVWVPQCDLDTLEEAQRIAYESEILSLVKRYRARVRQLRRNMPHTEMDITVAGRRL